MSKTENKHRRTTSKALRVGCGLGAVGGGAGLIGLIVSGFLYWQHVIVDPGPHLAPEHVRSIIAQESPVYYRDGVTRLGVFFEDEHRRYVPFDALPRAWMMGIVAAEDGTFWTHHGVSPKHLLRAMIHNAAAGTVVAGGSTLTQQTAKNLYYRPDRSIKSKLTELLNALRLEAHFEKSQILTFYANQFHVSGNGRGLGIASRYFFDKDPDQLKVEEAAFIAGLVKAPSRYDPFIGDEARRATARKKAQDRTIYVLRRMTTEAIEHLIEPQGVGESVDLYEKRLHEAASIRARAKVLLSEGFDLEFKKGTFRFDSNAVLDEVARRLAQPMFTEVLAKAGIDDPATAGLKVITTLDPVAQHSAVYGLWHHLSVVGTELEELTVEDYRVDGKVYFNPDRPIRERDFRRGTILETIETPKKHLRVDLGGRSCVIDRAAVVRAAVAVERGKKKNTRAKIKSAAVDAFADSLHSGDRVWVSIREIADTITLCDLEVRPELQGSIVVLEDGEIRAMVGGNDNRNFNRAAALRQMGSTWKPLIFHAALQLGWKPSDDLDNRRNVFPFSTTFYYPRPDHEPEPVVSMSWAGVRSENLASVWLLYHLTDRLDGRAIKELATSLGLARNEKESKKEYRRRIQKAGVLPTHGRLEEIDFLIARSDLINGGFLTHPEDSLALESMSFGWGFTQEAEKLRRAGGRETLHRLKALDNNYRSLVGKLSGCEAQYDLLRMAWNHGDIPEPRMIPDLSVMAGKEGIAVACGAMPEGFGPVAETIAEEAPESVTELPPAEPSPRGFSWKKLGQLVDAIRPRERRQPLVPFSDVIIDERVHAATLTLLKASIARQELSRSIAGEEAPGLYDPEVLYWHPDFRILLSLRYVQSLAGQYGVESEVAPVLSMPLGANEITLLELASVYQGITTGKSWEFRGRVGNSTLENPESTSLLIAEIRDVDDNILYRAEGIATQVAPRENADMTTDILRNVVLHGTGRRASMAVMESGHPIPLGGKTGTTNDFKNAAFAGFAPRSDGQIYQVESAYTVAAYVGYDDNRPMKNGRIRIAGASGALPAWIETISGMRQGGLLGSMPADGDFRIASTPSLVRVPVGPSGQVVTGQDYDPGTPSILVPLPTLSEAPTVRFEQKRRPARVAPTDVRSNERPQHRGLWGRRRRR